MHRSPQEFETIAYSDAPASERAAAFNLLAETASRTDLQQALVYAQEAIALGEPLEDPSHYLTARLHRAWIRHELGEYALSIREAAEVVKIARQNHLPEQLYDAYNILGNNHNQVGNRPEALTAFMEALQASATLNNPNKVATVENNIGLVYEGMKDFHKALEYYQKALATYKAGNAILILQSITGANVAESCNALGLFQQALPVAQEAFQLAAEKGYRVGMGKARLQCAIALAGMGRAEEAANAFEDALDHIRAADSPYNESLVLKHMAAEAIRHGRLPDGIELLDRALALVEPLQTLPAIFPLHEALAQVYEQTARSMSRLVISARRSGISNATSRSRNGFLTSRLITAKKHSMPCSSWIERGWKRKISGTGMKRSNGSLSTMKAWSLNWTRMPRTWPTTSRIRLA